MPKKGLSLVSMVLYVVIFFAFATIAISISTNMNMKTLSEKGKVYCNEQVQKLQYNILNSAKNSIYYDYIENSIVFSNNDEYTYDKEKKIILKNGGKLLTDVTNFEIINIDNLSGIKPNLMDNVDNNKEYICIRINFEKYSQNLSYDMFYTLGDESVE